ncbi:MAG: hypothetical protein LC715_07655, partial [Gammaproteobacteria bacterium]|nr:hypothetical protein [Gammaproteobacteria bacterium]
VDHPFLDRTATVYEVDHRWAPNAQWNIRTTAVASSVDQSGHTINDSGAQIRIDHNLGNGWRQQLYALHLGDNLQLNDFGFLERNNFNYVRYELGHRITDLPESSPNAAHDWRYAVSRRSNDDGVHIADAFAINRFSERRDGGNLLGTFRSDMLFLNAGVTWLIDNKQELRVRLEAIGLDAEAQQAWRSASATPSLRTCRAPASARSATRVAMPTGSTSTLTSTATPAPATTSPCCCPTASSIRPSPTRTSSTTTGTATGATPQARTAIPGRRSCCCPGTSRRCRRPMATPARLVCPWTA